MFADIATPELDGLRMCRAVKRSRRLSKVRVIAAGLPVVDFRDDPRRDPPEARRRWLLEKPLDTRRLHRRSVMCRPTRVDHEALLADALGRYHSGDIEGAIGRLRGALVGDPASPKLHFMLANMLQRASRWAEAVDEAKLSSSCSPRGFPR